ncbi:MAG: hypothetical protein AB7S81_05250 [Bdellovibrionales bacterium]
MKKIIWLLALVILPLQAAAYEDNNRLLTEPLLYSQPKSKTETNTPDRILLETPSYPLERKEGEPYGYENISPQDRPLSSIYDYDREKRQR